MESFGLAIASLVLLVSSTALADPPPPPPRGAATTLPWPWYDATAPVPTKTHSPGLIGGGVFLMVLGAASITGGAVVIHDARGDFGGLAIALFGVPLLVNGIGLVIAGIPMIAVGAKQIPLNSSKDTRSPTPSVMVTPRSAALSWSF